MNMKVKMSKENAQRLREARVKTGEAAKKEIESRPKGKKMIKEYVSLIKMSFEAEGIPFSSAYIKAFLAGAEQTSLLTLPEGMKYGLACVLYVDTLKEEGKAVEESLKDKE